MSSHYPYCDLCGIETHPEALERVNVFPLEMVCPPCAAELRADEDDPTSGEPECDCRSFCTACTPGA
jgi:hypothetical protein